MYYNLRARYASRVEKLKIKQLEKQIDKCLEETVHLIDNEFKDYVRSFGITGPAANGEATIFFSQNKLFGSDIDLAVVTKFRSKTLETKLRKKVMNIFEKTGVEVGLLTFSPSIFKKPDLMFYEYCKSGKQLFGEKINFSWGIPIWEAAKVLSSRSGKLFDSIHFSKRIKFSNAFPYSWSKAILGSGEALLILEGKYAFTLKNRKKQITKLRIAKEIPNFVKFYNKAFRVRFTGEMTGDKQSMLKETSKIMSNIFLIISQELTAKSKKSVHALRAPMPSKISTRFFFFFNSLKAGKLKIPLSEPLVQEFIEMENMFNLLANSEVPSEKNRTELIHLWKYADRFWLPY